MPTSYRRNRDYSRQFTWTEELNEDLYQCFLRAKSDPSIGYMKRMKTYWDEKHPELSHFSDRNLREQANRVHKKRVANDNQENFIENQNLETVDEPIPRGEIVNDQLPIVENQNIAPEEIHNTVTNNNDHDEQLDILRAKFKTNYDLYIIKELPERVNVVNNKPIDKKLFSMIDTVLKEHLESLVIIDFWQLNTSIYTAALTANEHNGDVINQQQQPRKKKQVPKWIINLENSITSCRRLIAKLTVVINCKKQNSFTTKQRKLSQFIERKFHTKSRRHLEFKLESLKHKLSANAAKLRYQKRLSDRRQINRQFSSNPKFVYRKMRGEQITVQEVPTKTDVENFWKGIWSKEGTFNTNATWLNNLHDYCSDAEQKAYVIENKTITKIVKKLQVKKAPGPDMIGAFWYKKLASYLPFMTTLFESSFNGQIEMPQWMAKARTVLTPKNKQTSIPKNYRPIACLNIMYKIFTGCVNLFLCDHCDTNNVITVSQNGGKKNVWGTTEQLLLNKTVLKEARSRRRNLTTVWLDYKKAFDSVPHQWLIRSLELAKVPDKIVNIVRKLNKIWSTQVHLQGETNQIITDTIHYKKGIFQGDSLSVVLFVLSVNPLSHMLNKLNGYAAGQNKSLNITHNFFVDDLKLYAATQSNLYKLLSVVTTFSKDIDMQFGIDKCAYVKIEKGKQVSCRAKINVNDLEISPVADGDTYRYLGQDENVEFVGAINKERVTKELYQRCRKVWSSELSAYHKATAHNVFVTSVIVPTFGIIDWTIEDLKKIDIRIRKLMAMNSCFHPNSDVDRLYVTRFNGGRGLKSIQNMFEGRIISLKLHLERNRNRNNIMNYIYENEQNNANRVGQSLIDDQQLRIDNDTKPRSAARQYIKSVQKQKSTNYEAKVVHGYIQRKAKTDPSIDSTQSQKWLQDKYLSSHFVSYACAIQEQEIPTKYLISKRNNTHDNKCRLCKVAVEDIIHVTSSCPLMSSRYYLPLRHDVIAKEIYKEHIKKHTGTVIDVNKLPYESIEKLGDFEYWWNVSVQTASRVPCNKPDIVIWDRKSKVCSIVEISCPADNNVTRKTKEKIDKYGPLIRNMQMIHSGYKFRMIPIIVGCLGYICKDLSNYLTELGLDKSLIKKLETLTVSGTVKIVKSFLGFKN